MRLGSLWMAVAFASATTAQFIFPDASSSVQINQAIQIRWNTAGLQAPLSINLVPAGTAIRQDIVLQQVAVNIGNVGILQWTADQTITAFPKFAMVITDARSRVVVSQPFLIPSLTKQPSPPIDLGGNGKNGNGGNGGGNKQEGGKNEKDGNKQNGNKDANKGDNKNQNKDGKDANKDGKQDDKKEKEDEAAQKEKVTDKQEKDEEPKTSLLPLPGLPKDNAPPATLLPLPTVPSVPASKSAAESRPAAPKPSPAAPATSQEKPKTPEATSPASPAPEPVEKEVAAPSAAAPNGFSTIQPAAAPTSGPLREVKEAALPTRLETADALQVFPGGSFREQTSEVVVPTTLPSQKGQETITTAITPRPGRFASSTSSPGSFETQDPSAAGRSKPTVLSENTAPRAGPSLMLGLAGAVAWLVLV